MRTTSQIILCVVVLVATACSEKPGQENRSRAQMLSTAITAAGGLVGYNTEWQCAGSLYEDSNEFVVAAVQSNPQNGELFLTVDRLVVSITGEGYSRKGLFMDTVKADLIDNSLDLWVYTSKVQESLPLSDRQVLAKYSAKRKYLVIDRISYGGSKIAINCAQGSVIY